MPHTGTWLDPGCIQQLLDPSQDLVLQASFQDAHLQPFKGKQVRPGLGGSSLLSAEPPGPPPCLASGTFTWKCGGLGPRVTMRQCSTTAVKGTRGRGGGGNRGPKGNKLQ